MSAPNVEMVTRREFARLEGCDEKQVRRALERGLLVASSEGKLDPAQIATGWRRLRVDSREAPAQHRADTADISADMGGDIRNVRSDVPTQVSPPAGQGAHGSTSNPAGKALQRAVLHKEDFAGRLKELHYRQEAEKVIEASLAREVMFSEFDAQRDEWLAWPERFGASIARDLGIQESARVQEVLGVFVQKQLATLGRPSGEFRKR